jgi:hypothetical protein
VGAVINADGKARVAVKKPDGGVDWRDVILGRSNGERIEVKQGLQSGEVVIRNPRSLGHEGKRGAGLSAPPSPTPQPGIPR